MNTLYYIVQLLVCIAVIVDMYRRPDSAWASADRQRGFWAGTFGVLALFGVGVVVVVIYLVFLVPRLRTPYAGGGEVSEGFRKPPAR